MSETNVDLYRSVLAEQFPGGVVLDGEPAPALLHPDFEPRLLPSGRQRLADVDLSEDKQWVLAGGGTSLFDQPNVFKGGKWLSFKLPKGTVVPDSLLIRFTGHNKSFKADHYQIESRAQRMHIDAYKGALDNLARNAIVRQIALIGKA